MSQMLPNILPFARPVTFTRVQDMFAFTSTILIFPRISARNLLHQDLGLVRNYFLHDIQ